MANPLLAAIKEQRKAGIDSNYPKKSASITGWWKKSWPIDLRNQR
jgi:hypothetical protein